MNKSDLSKNKRDVPKLYYITLLVNIIFFLNWCQAVFLKPVVEFDHFLFRHPVICYVHSCNGSTQRSHRKEIFYLILEIERLSWQCLMKTKVITIILDIINGKTETKRSKPKEKQKKERGI